MRNIYNVELHDVYSLPNIVQVIKSRRTRNVVRMRERRGVYRGFVGKPEEKRPLRRPRCR
jgi:hypothetical protein